MEIIEERPVMVFRKDFDGNTTYSVGMSHRNTDGTYNNYYLKCKFKKDVDVPNLTKIHIHKAWIDGYMDKNKQSQVFIFISEFTEVEKDEKEVQKEKKKVPESVEKMKEVGFEEEGSEDDLPF